MILEGKCAVNDDTQTLNLGMGERETEEVSMVVLVRMRRTSVSSLFSLRKLGENWIFLEANTDGCGWDSKGVFGGQIELVSSA